MRSTVHTYVTSRNALHWLGREMEGSSSGRGSFAGLARGCALVTWSGGCGPCGASCRCRQGENWNHRCTWRQASVGGAFRVKLWLCLGFNKCLRRSSIENRRWCSVLVPVVYLRAFALFAFSFALKTFFACFVRQQGAAGSRDGRRVAKRRRRVLTQMRTQITQIHANRRCGPACHARRWTPEVRCVRITSYNSP
jgi:hypothetical protein